ncbi:hypothetical protein JCM11251_007589 [Rhodosporidiobolus azoricus]
MTSQPPPLPLSASLPLPTASTSSALLSRPPLPVSLHFRPSRTDGFARLPLPLIRSQATFDLLQAVFNLNLNGKLRDVAFKEVVCREQQGRGSLELPILLSAPLLSPMEMGLPLGPLHHLFESAHPTSTSSRFSSEPEDVGGTTVELQGGVAQILTGDNAGGKLSSAPVLQLSPTNAAAHLDSLNLTPTFPPSV